MSSDIAGAFVRQRRSLMLVSIILSVVLIFGIEGTKARLSPGAGSISVNFGSTDVIVSALWVAWGWFLFRYWQHFLVARIDDFSELQRLQTVRIGNLFRVRMLSQASEVLKKRLTDKYPDADSVEFAGPGVTQDVQRVGWRRVTLVVTTTQTVTIKGGGRNRAHDEAEEIILKAPKIWPTLLRAVFPVNLKHRYFSEYWTAFVFASTPPLVVAYQFVPELVQEGLRQL